jgi:predicted AlkP superfamily pyrophosphatase or phosphodiesterase
MQRKNSRCVLVFFLDAFRDDDITPENTPYLFGLTKRGISGSMETILGFTGIAATMFAGSYPAEHGVWTQYKLSTTGSPFDWIKPFSGQLEKVDVLLRKRGPKMLRKGLGLSILQLSRYRSGMTYYPGVHRIPYTYMPKFDFSIRKRIQDNEVLGSSHQTLFDILLENGISFSIVDYPLLGSDHTVLQRVLQIKKVPELIYIRFMDLDPVSHYYGLGSAQRAKKLKETDNAVRLCTEHLRKLGYDPFSVIFADHGMLEVTRVANIVSLLKKLSSERKDFIMFLDSTMARFWGNEAIMAEISKRLSLTDFGKILTKKDLDYYNASLDSSYGNLIFLANPGTVFVPNYFEDSPGVKAMHGYDPTVPGQQTIFILDHSSLKFKKLEKVKLVDILPTILEILGVSPTKKYVGESKLH